MKIKGLFMLANDNPGFKESNGGRFYYMLLSFLEKQTTLILVPFWIELEKKRTQKLECCKHFVLVSNLGALRLDCTLGEGAVFVMMCGRTTVVSAIIMYFYCNFFMFFLKDFCLFLHVPNDIMITTFIIYTHSHNIIIYSLIICV